MTLRILSVLSVFIFMLSCAPDNIGGDANKTETVSAPVFNQIDGQYFGEQKINISSSTSGATIKYTPDGSEPTVENGMLYQNDLTISNSTVVKAIALKTGMNNSSVSSVTYNIINWKGEFATIPENHVAGWAYYNSTDGVSYIYDGTAWKILAKDGKNAESTSSDNVVNATWILDMKIESSIVYNSKLYLKLVSLDNMSGPSPKIVEYDGTSFTELINMPFSYLGSNLTMLVINNMLLVYYEDGDICSYNGSEVALINKGTSDYNRKSGYLIIHGSKVLFKGTNTNNEYSLYEYDGTSVKNIIITQGSSDANITELLFNSNFMVFNNKLILKSGSWSSSKYYVVNTDYSLSNLNLLQYIQSSFTFNNKYYFTGGDSNSFGLYTYDETTGSQNIVATSTDTPFIHKNYLYMKKDGKPCRYDGTSFTDVKSDNSLGYLTFVSFNKRNTFIYNDLIYINGLDNFFNFNSGSDRFLEYNPTTNILKRASFPITFILKDTKTVLDVNINNFIEYNGKYLFNNDFGCYISE